MAHSSRDSLVIYFTYFNNKEILRVIRTRFGPGGNHDKSRLAARALAARTNDGAGGAGRRCSARKMKRNRTDVRDAFNFRRFSTGFRYFTVETDNTVHRENTIANSRRHVVSRREKTSSPRRFLFFFF